jgi:hypothetical protein
VMSPEVAEAITKRQGQKYYYHNGSGGASGLNILGGPSNGQMSADERFSQGVNTAISSAVDDLANGAGDRVYLHGTKSYGGVQSGTYAYQPNMVNTSTEIYANASDGWGIRPDGTDNDFVYSGGMTEYMYKRKFEPEQMTYSIVESETGKQQVIDKLHELGMTEIHGRKIEDILVTTAEFKQLANQPGFRQIGLGVYANDAPITTLLGQATPKPVTKKGKKLKVVPEPAPAPTPTPEASTTSLVHPGFVSVEDLKSLVEASPKKSQIGTGGLYGGFGDISHLSDIENLIGPVVMVTKDGQAYYRDAEGNQWYGATGKPVDLDFLADESIAGYVYALTGQESEWGAIDDLWNALHVVKASPVEKGAYSDPGVVDIAKLQALAADDPYALDVAGVGWYASDADSLKGPLIMTSTEGVPYFRETTGAWFGPTGDPLGHSNPLGTGPIGGVLLAKTGTKAEFKSVADAWVKLHKVGPAEPTVLSKNVQTLKDLASTYTNILEFTQESVTPGLWSTVLPDHNVLVTKDGKVYHKAGGTNTPWEDDGGTVYAPGLTPAPFTLEDISRIYNSSGSEVSNGEIESLWEDYTASVPSSTPTATAAPGTDEVLKYLADVVSKYPSIKQSNDLIMKPTDKNVLLVTKDGQVFYKDNVGKQWQSVEGGWYTEAPYEGGWEALASVIRPDPTWPTAGNDEIIQAWNEIKGPQAGPTFPPAVGSVAMAVPLS